MNSFTTHRRKLLAAMAALGGGSMLSGRTSAFAQADEGPYSIARSQHWRVPRKAAPDLVVWAAWPEGPPPAAGWPLAVMLDGDENFALAALMLQRRERSGRNQSANQGAVLLGLSSGSLAQRIWDYTPPTADRLLPADVPGAGYKIGGADSFLRLLRDQILPQAEKRWPIDPQRKTLVGHSFGGLLALYAAMQKDCSFSRIAAISPSVWYGGGLLAHRAEQTQPAPISALIAAGEHEAGPDKASGLSAQRLAEQLRGKWRALRWRSLGELSHGATMQAAMGDALDLALAP